MQPLQLPVVQLWPVGQLWQAPPFAPQLLASVPAMQVLPEQQPPGQLAAVHAHWPLRQR